MTPQQHRARATQLRASTPASWAAELHELAANAIERMNSNASRPQEPQSIAELLPSMTLQQKLQYAEQQRDKYSEIAASPHLSLPAALAAQQSVRSYQAAVTLFEKAQAYEGQKRAAALAQKNAEIWLHIAADPTLSPERALSARNIARSYQNKAHAYEAGDQADAMTGLSAIPQPRAQVPVDQAPTSPMSNQTLAIDEQHASAHALQPPLLPSLEEFGLSHAAMAHLPKRFFGPSNGFTRGLFMIGGTVVLTIICLSYHAPALILLAILFGAPLGLIPHAALGQLEKTLLSVLNEDFRRASLYWIARENYLREKGKYDARVRKHRQDYWRALSGTAFEAELGKLFTLMGYNVRHTPTTGDGGVDLILRKDNKITVVQCKAHNKRIPISVARELSASVVDFHADAAIIACFEGATQPVVEYIKDKPITVLELNEIIALQARYG